MKKAIIIILIFTLLITTTSCAKKDNTQHLIEEYLKQTKLVEKFYYVEYTASVVINDSVGDEWSFAIICENGNDTEIEGLVYTDEETPIFTLCAREKDNISDYGYLEIEFSDLNIGQSEEITQFVVVTENCGRYSGNQAIIEFIVTCTRFK